MSELIEIPAGKFKAECLKLLDEVASERHSLVITKRGVPVAQLVPLPLPKSQRLFGALSGNVLHEGDIVSPLENEWAADQ